MNRTQGVTLKQIAAEVGVSVQAVSRVLSGGPPSIRVSVARASQIEATARRLGYRSFQGKPQRPVRPVGVVTADHPPHCFEFQPNHELILGIEQELESLGYRAVALRFNDAAERTHDSAVSAKRWLLAGPSSLAGLIVVGPVPPTVVEAISDLKLPKVWVCNGAGSNDIRVERDELSAGRAALRRISGFNAEAPAAERVYVAHPATTDSRFEAPKHRLQGVKIEAAARHVHCEEVSIESAQQGRDWLASLPKGSRVVSTSHQITRAIVAWCAQAGLVLGRDIRLVCVDDATDAQLWLEGLTRIAFDRPAMGRSAARLLAKAIDGEPVEHLIFPGDQVIDGWTDQPQ